MELEWVLEWELESELELKLQPERELERELGPRPLKLEKYAWTPKNPDFGPKRPFGSQIGRFDECWRH